MPHRKRLPSRPARPDLDLIGRMRVYEVASGLMEVSWDDAMVLDHHPLTKDVAPQLYAAVVSIAANLAEGYSRSSGRDRARIFEYALGSARESTVWYKASAKVLPGTIVGDRGDRLEEIKRMLLAIIPRERTRLIRPTRAEKVDC